MTGKRALIVLLILTWLLGVACQDEPPPPAPTGFAVAPVFDGWQTAYGPDLLGAPITGQCLPGDGRIVQYFENVRLEYDPEGDVSPYPLGQWALSGVRSRVPAPVPANSPTRTFAETGYSVQDQFLIFYEQNDGENLLGPPLSEQLDEGELRVQYFRNGRLEWRPDAPPDRRVRLSVLGQAHYQQTRAADMQCDLLGLFDPAAVPSSVRLTASVAAPILHTTVDEQVVYVKVTGPNDLPFGSINVSVTVTYRDEVIEVDLGETAQDGVASGSLGMIRFDPDEDVRLEVTASSGSGVALGRTSLTFKTWW
ncbi:MAG: hypothetical protein RRC07_13100 [Anaerolineae bacterium]|nr:hypothetical protein [Anaerolineae bacterium]